MIVPLLITGGILGGLYLWGPRAEAPRPANEERPTRVIPQDQIPPTLLQRMQQLLTQLPAPVQAQLPMAMWGDPNAWTQAAQVLNTLQPGSPQSPELMAIAQALRGLPLPQPTPLPLPPLSGPIPVPPALQTQLNQVLAGLPPPFNAAIPSFPFPGPPSTGPLAPSIDPAVLTLLAQQIEAALPGRTEPNQLRAIAAQLASTRAPAPGAMQVRAINIGPAAMNAASVYEQIIRNQGGTVAPDASRVLSFLQSYGGAPPVAGVPARVAGESSRYALHPQAFQRRRYMQARGW